MSLESVEKALRDNDAVKNHEEVLAEKKALKAEVLRQKEEARERGERHSNQVRELEEKISELLSPRIRYKKNSYTPQAFSKLVSSEIEKEHLARIKQGIEAKWAIEAPLRTREALKRELAGGLQKCSPEIRAIIEQNAAKKADAILHDRASWPQWFIDLYEAAVKQGVQRGLDSTFNSRVNEEASREIFRRVNIAWPKFLAERVTPRFQGNLISQLQRFNETIIVRCDKCGNEYLFNLTPDNIAGLIKDPHILIRCLNPSCRNLFGPHNFPLTLGYLIYYLTKNQT